MLAGERGHDGISLGGGLTIREFPVTVIDLVRLLV